MRYFRNFVIVCTLFLCLAGMSRPRATDSLFTVRDCTDPAKPCATTGDGVNTVIPLNPTFTKIASTIDEILNTKFALEWSGYVKPLGDTYFNGNPKLDSFSNQIQSASDFELNPAQLQESERHDESSKSASMTSRICVLDPKTGEMKDALSETTIVTADQPWLRTQGEGSRRLSSFTTGYTQESQDYNLPNITIKQNAALPCGSPQIGESKPLEAKPSNYENDYGKNAVTSIASIVFQFTKDIIKTITHSDGTSSFSGTLAATANIVGTAQNPFAGHVDALTAGCASSSDLNDVSYATAEQKQKLCAAGGFVNSMYRQDEIDPTFKSQLNAQYDNQPWEQTFIKEQPTAPNSSAFAARVEAAGDYTNCTLMPADYQSIAGMSDTCNKNWVGSTGTGCNAQPTDTAISQAISKAETTYGIPSGMLRAIYEIEALDLGIANPSDYVCKRNKDIPGHLPDTSAGLTQLNDGAYASVTCGKGMQDDVAECSQKQAGQLSRCDINDTFELAARLLLLKVGKWDNTGCKATGKITTNSEMYTAACRYGTGFAPTPLTIQYDYNLPRQKRTGGSMNYCDIVCNKMGRCGPNYPPQIANPPNW